MRIAVTNTVALNGGDAAIAVAIVESIRRAAPRAMIELHDSRPAVAARYHPSLRWKPSLAALARPRRFVAGLNRRRLLAAARLWRSARPLAAALLRAGERRRIADFAALDMVVSTGGTYLVEHYDLRTRIFELQMAQALGVPTVFYTQSLGPFRQRRNRRPLRAVFSASPLVLLRDERSRGHLLDLGVPGERLHVVADAVFGRADARPFGAKPVRSVAVSVRAWPPGAAPADPAMFAFRRAIAAAVSWLVRERGVELTFLSTCQGISEYWTDDSAVAEAVAAALPDDVRAHVHVDRDFHAPDALADAYASFDIVLATRMHAAILALTAGTPVLPIAYEFKTTELFRALGLGDYVVPIDGIEPERLRERTSAFLDQLPALIETLRAGVEAQRAQARRAEELLAATLANRGGPATIPDVRRLIGGAAKVTSRAVVRTLNPDDDTLAAVVRALRSPSADEDGWALAIEAIRARLQASDETLRFQVHNRDWWERAIAASRDPQPPVLHDDHVARSVGEVTRVTSKPPEWGRLLYRIARELQPERCLELGTSVGMSGCYIGAGLTANGRGRLITIEGEEPSARVARGVFEEAGVADRVEVMVGQFADELPAALESLGGVELAFVDGHHQYEPTMSYFATILEATAPGGLLVFDDVTYGLGDMEAAWREIRANPRVTGSMTVGAVGFAVVDGRRAEHRRVPRLTVSA